MQSSSIQPPAIWVERASARHQPGAGIAMGYDDLKVIEAHRLVTSIATGRPVLSEVGRAVGNSLILRSESVV
mgnify:CR=1 FL=1